jgi:hypothetical protein
MNRMRKGLAALAAAVFFLSVGGVAQAVIGVPDDVPGSTLLYPFFKVNPDRTATDTQDTLLVVTNTAGPTTSGTTGTLAQSGVAPNVAVHVTIWSATSVHVYDFSVILTPHDVWSCSLFDLIIGGTGCEQALPAPLGVRSALETKVDGKTELIGYATADLVYSPTSLFPGQNNYPFGYGNILIGHMYLVNLINGSSTGFNAVSIETDNPCYGHNALPVTGQLATNSRGFYRTRCEDEQGAAACSPVGVAASCPAGGGAAVAYGDFGERIDGPNGDWAQTGTAGGHSGITPDSPLSLLVRYFSASSIKGRTEVWQWKDRNTTASAGAVNVAVYDEAENVHSVQLSLPNEVNFALTAQIITPGAPGGWFRIKYPCAQFGSCTYNYLTPPGGSSTTPARPPIQSVAYAVQFAQSSDATLRWDAAFPAHRQYTNYRNVSE